jgi:hypothetical protein
MRITARILLLLVVTGALWLGARGPSLLAETATRGTNGATAERASSGLRVARDPNTAPERRAGQRPDHTQSTFGTPATPSPPSDLRATPLSESHLEEPGDSEDDTEWSRLDSASETVIRHALTQAIDRQRALRPLFISAGVVDAAAIEGRVRVIFHTAHLDAPASAARGGLPGLLSGAVGEARWERLRLFPLLGHGAVEVGPQALLHLIEADSIDHIELDRIHRPSLDTSVPLIGADLAHQAGEDGDGLAIAILDTGVDTTHPMLAGRVLDEACFSADRDCPNGETEMFGPGAAVPCSYDCGHGTYVAGVAAGGDTGNGLVGVAPHAMIIPIQIFSEIGGSAGAYSSDILAGLQHVLALTAFYDIAVANLSFGGKLYNSEASCDEEVASQRAAVALLRNAGVATVAAAGNESLTNAITTPACLSNVIGVGSSTSADSVSSYSNSAEFLSLLAPGESIESSAMGGGTTIGNGTSMATPHVSGAIAIMREAVASATVDEIENALLLSGMPILDDRNGITKPRLQVDAAVALLASTPIAPESPGGDGSGGEPATVASSGGSSGGSSCGLVGIEPFLAWAGLQLALGLSKRRRPR